MERIVLGKTGIEANRLGFGGIPIQRVSEEQAVDAVLYALEKGMDFIDTSRMYTTSETRIGKALSQTAKKPVIATKSFCRTADDIRKDVETSLRELRRDVIDIYQCHSISTLDEYRKITSKDGAYGGLVKAREEGLIRHIGITSHSLDMLSKALDDDLFDTIMVCFSFLEPAAKETVIPKALAKNVGVLIMKALSGGIIEASETALRWVFGHHSETLALVGVENRELIDQNWSVFQGSHKLTEADHEIIDTIFREHDKKFCRRCDYCLPCPAGITIQYVLGARIFLKRMGAGALKAPIFADMWSKAEKCEECGQCVTRCPYGLPIPEMIKANVEWRKSLDG